PDEVIGIIQDDVIGRANGEGRGARDGDVATVADETVGGDVQITGDRRSAERERVDIAQGDVVAVNDADRADKVIGVIEHDVVGGAGCQSSGTGHGDVGDVTDEAIGGGVQIT